MGSTKKPISVFEGINLQNHLHVLKKLREFRSEGTPNQLPELISLLNSSDNEEIKSNIIQILNDLKSKEAIPFLISEIANPANINIQNILVSSCWQNGLDFNNYLDFFSELMVKCNYLTAIETFTVIEEMNIGKSEEKINKAIELLKKDFKSFNQDKQFLVKELINVLEDKKMAG